MSTLENRSDPSPYYDHGGIQLYLGDCRDVELPIPDCIIADPPYSQTALAWDIWQTEWPVALGGLSMWCFGTLRMFVDRAREFSGGGWKMSQDVIWEKHNGSSFQCDRFRRVHEQIVHFYRGPWSNVYHATPTTSDATKRTVRRKNKPAHFGAPNPSTFTSKDGGPRQMRSVIYCRSTHGQAFNETQKPIGLVKFLIQYACPPRGLVLSPFCGAGSDLVAAKAMGMRGIGVDVREDQLEIAAKRLEQEVFDFGDGHASEVTADRAPERAPTITLSH